MIAHTAIEGRDQCRFPHHGEMPTLQFQVAFHYLRMKTTKSFFCI